MPGREVVAILGLFSLLWWPIALAIMFFLRRRFPPSNETYAAFRAIAYVAIFWIGRTAGTMAGGAAASHQSAGAEMPWNAAILFSLPIAIIWIFVAYRLIERISWQSLGWKFFNLKRELAFGVLLGAILFLLRNYEFIFSKKPTLHVDIKTAAIVFFASFGVAAWQEENIYRGYLQPKLSNLIGKWRANVFQGVLFSIAHIGYYSLELTIPFFIGLVELALVGIVLGFYRQKYDSLTAPFIAHGLLDFLPLFWR